MIENAQVATTLRLLGGLVLGGVLALFVRLLYRRFSRSLSNRESFSSVFVPLTVSTVLVISVVKSSLALSLGLVGALSIVRFRAAIKDPEELIYLFFCIALGLALGADQTVAALIGVVVFTLFVVTLSRVRERASPHHLLVTITGDRTTFFAPGGESPEQLLSRTLGSYEIQRLELEEDRVQLRATIRRDGQGDLVRAMADLQARLPNAQISYVNLENLL